MANILYSNYTSTSTSFLGNERDILKVYEDMYLKYIKPLLPTQNKDSICILDVGCGWGWGGLIKVLQQDGYTSSTGFDISTEQIETAKSLGVKNVIAQSIEQFCLDTKDGSFEYILLFDILEHFPADKGVDLIQNMYRLLKPEGKIIIQVPNGNSLMSINFYGDITHYKAFNTSSLGQIAKMTGFQEEFYKEVLPLLPLKKKILSRFLWHLIIKPLSRIYMLATVGNSAGKVYTPNIIAVWSKKN